MGDPGPALAAPRPRRPWYQADVRSVLLLVAALAALAWAVRMRLGKDPEIEWRARTFDSPDPAARLATVRELIPYMRSPAEAEAARPVAERGLVDPDPRVRRLAVLLAAELARAYGKPAPPAQVARTQRMLAPVARDPDAPTRLALVEELAALGSVAPGGVSPLRAVLQDEVPAVRTLAYQTLLGAALPAAERNALARRGLDDPAASVRRAVAQWINDTLIRREPTPSGWPKITSELDEATVQALAARMLHDPSPEVRWAASRPFWDMPDPPPSVGPLLRAALEPRPIEVGRRVLAALAGARRPARRPGRRSLRRPEAVGESRAFGPRGAAHLARTAAAGRGR